MARVRLANTRNPRASKLTVEAGTLDILDVAVAGALHRIRSRVVDGRMEWKLVGLDAYGRRVAGEVGL